MNAVWPCAALADSAADDTHSCSGTDSDDDDTIRCFDNPALGGPDDCDGSVSARSSLDDPVPSDGRSADSVVDTVSRHDSSVVMVSGAVVDRGEHAAAAAAATPRDECDHDVVDDDIADMLELTRLPGDEPSVHRRSLVPRSSIPVVGNGSGLPVQAAAAASTANTATGDRDVEMDTIDADIAEMLAMTSLENTVLPRGGGDGSGGGESGFDAGTGTGFAAAVDVDVDTLEREVQGVVLIDNHLATTDVVTGAPTAEYAAVDVTDEARSGTCNAVPGVGSDDPTASVAVVQLPASDGGPGGSHSTPSTTTSSAVDAAVSQLEALCSSGTVSRVEVDAAALLQELQSQLHAANAAIAEIECAYQCLLMQVTSMQQAASGHPISGCETSEDATALSLPRVGGAAACDECAASGIPGTLDAVSERDELSYSSEASDVSTGNE